MWNILPLSFTFFAISYTGWIVPISLLTHPTETIFISSKEKPVEGDYDHFAIFVADGLYLSKFGNAGKMTVTSLEEMKKFYGAEHVFKIKPKENPTPPST